LTTNRSGRTAEIRPESTNLVRSKTDRIHKIKQHYSVFPLPTHLFSNQAGVKMVSLSLQSPWTRIA